MPERAARPSDDGTRSARPGPSARIIRPGRRCNGEASSFVGRSAVAPLLTMSINRSHGRPRGGRNPGCGYRCGDSPNSTESELLADNDAYIVVLFRTGLQSDELEVWRGQFSSNDFCQFGCFVSTLSEQNAVYVLELVNALVKASSVCDLVFQSAATLLDFMLLLAP